MVIQRTLDEARRWTCKAVVCDLPLRWFCTVTLTPDMTLCTGAGLYAYGAHSDFVAHVESAGSGFHAMVRASLPLTVYCKSHKIKPKKGTPDKE